MSEKTITQSKESTPEKVFTPTPHMEKWLVTAIQSETDEITTIARESGMDKSSWYKWLDLPGFIEWFEAEWNRKLLGSGWKLDAIGLKQAKRDHRYWESMQKRMGRLQEKNTNIQVNVLNHLKKEKDEFGI